MSKVVIVVLLLSSLQVGRVAAINLTISPDHLHITTDPQSVTFTCDADVALAGCQFRWWDKYKNKLGPLLELSRGSQSRADPAHLTRDLTGYSYSGRGLGAGDCGVSLQVTGWKLWMVACRVRAESGGWTYAWADFVAISNKPLPHNLTTPREVVVLPGGEARFILEAGEPLNWCWFCLPAESAWLSFTKGPESPHSTGRRRYIGAGSPSGHCGLALTNVSEVDNGPVGTWILSQTLKSDERYMALVVARPPTAPTLSLAYTGTHVTATCEVQESRPVARISWILGDDIIRQDENDDSESSTWDDWRWPWMQAPIQQTLTLELQPQHNGKDLKCRVSHIALAQPLEAKTSVGFAGQKCISENLLDLLCQQTRLPATQLANTSWPSDEVYAFRVREAGAAARTAELAEEAGMLTLVAAQVSLDAARAHARAEEARAKNAEEELQYERERRART